MKSKISFIALIGLFVVLAICSCSAVDDVSESEQRIASMEINQSAGNMTGDDYLVALMYAYINDTMNKNSINDPSRPNFRSVQSEATSKFEDYSVVYTSDQLDTELNNLMSSSTTRVCSNEPSMGTTCKLRYVKPDQGYIDGFLFNLFNKGKLSELIDEARNSSQARLKEEVHLEAVRREKEEKQLRAQQEDEARQTSLDAHYKNISENYSTELTNLLNQSRFEDALNLSNEAIGNLVSPYSNVMEINQGDIYVSMGIYEAAIESYKNAQTDFTYSNESADYKVNITQDFGNNWGRIIQMKAGMALEYRAEQLHAMAFDDLRDAPNVKQLLSGHLNIQNYNFRVINYTAPDYSDIDDPGYWVQINISAYNDPEEIDDTEYLRKNIPICVDMFTALFSDEQISKVFIQLNESYLDKFGHTLESPFITMRLNNATAAKIGDWKSFKKYIGTDMSKFEQVIESHFVN